jgi:hypothetical protein
MNAAFQYLAILFVVAVILDLLIISGWKNYRRLLQEHERAKRPIDKRLLLKQAFYSDQLRWGFQRVKQILANTRVRSGLMIALELGVLALWAINVGWDYLDMDPRVMPAGREFGSAIQSNHLWTQVLKCGWCAVWNGSERGGFPAFADIQGSMLHPLSIAATLIWGVLNGVKVTIVASLWFAGLAQWWIARELSLGWAPRMWAAGIAITGGHLAGRMQLGVWGVVLSTAMTSLVFAALIRLARTRKRRDAVLLGIITASAILSGQGYIQIGLIAILPAAVLFLIDKPGSFESWKNHLLAGGIALLLAAPLLVPLAHFSPNIVKWMDPAFKSAQPIQYLALNLVIDDPLYFHSDLLQKFPYPYLYTLYIGWIPVLFAIFALSSAPRRHRKFIWFLAAGTLIEFLVASAIPLKWLADIWPTIAGIRHPPQIAGLAIPLILGLAAYGLEKLLAFRWTIPLYARGRQPMWNLPAQWLLLIPLAVSLQSCRQFAQVWITTEYRTDDLYKTLEMLQTEDIQWVETPFGEHAYVEPAIAMGMKLSPGITTWLWRNRTTPEAVLYAARAGVPPGRVRKIRTQSGITYYARDNSPYAGVISEGNNKQPCRATGSGGEIHVACNVEQAGKLVVLENMWTGWQAQMDGRRIPLIGTDWLEVTAPAGQHTFTFRYLPWDVPLGLILFVAGVITSLYYWRRTLKR